MSRSFARYVGDRLAAGARALALVRCSCRVAASRRARSKPPARSRCSGCCGSSSIPSRCERRRSCRGCGACGRRAIRARWSRCSRSASASSTCCAPRSSRGRSGCGRASSIGSSAVAAERLLARYLAADYLFHARRRSASLIEPMTRASDIAYELVAGSAVNIFAEAVIIARAGARAAVFGAADHAGRPSPSSSRSCWCRS